MIGRREKKKCFETVRLIAFIFDLHFWLMRKLALCLGYLLSSLFTDVIF